MPRDTRTRKKTRHSSLCKKVELTLPTAWDQLTQEQLHHVLRLFVMFDGEEYWLSSAKIAAFLFFCGITIERRVPRGWLCSMGDKYFVLAHDLLPAVLHPLEWMGHPEQMTVRLEKWGERQAADMWLYGFLFGDYLKLENFYQGYLATHAVGNLKEMAGLLYEKPETETKEPELDDIMQLNVLLWFGAIKARFTREFPHFLKPPSGNSSKVPDQRAITVAQIRALTQGDVTKNNAVMNTDTWDALTELEALAVESEELKKKYGKGNV